MVTTTKSLVDGGKWWALVQFLRSNINQTVVGVVKKLLLCKEAAGNDDY